ASPLASPPQQPRPSRQALLLGATHARGGPAGHDAAIPAAPSQRPPGDPSHRLAPSGGRMDLFDKCNAMVRHVQETRAAGLYPYYRALTSAQEPLVLMGDRELVMLGSNNSLGLANPPEVKEAAAEALALYGTGCAGSRLLNGTLDLHLELEQKLAEFTRREDALTFSTGFQVN